MNQSLIFFVGVSVKNPSITSQNHSLQESTLVTSTNCPCRPYFHV